MQETFLVKNVSYFCAESNIKLSMDEVSKFDDPKFVELMDKIVSMFFEFGIRNLNMDDISRNLKISKKTLYQYFKSKEDLIEKLFEYDEIKWNNEFSKTDISACNAIEVLLIASLMVFKEMQQLDAKLKFELKKYYEAIYTKFFQRKQIHIYTQISKNMKKGIEEGLYRSDLNIELMAGLYVKYLVESQDKDFCFAENITVEQIFKVMFESHIRAIATPQGIDYFEKRKLEIIQANKDINK